MDEKNIKVHSSLIRINSADGIYEDQTKSNFIVHLDDSVSNNNVIKVEVKSIQFPHVFYNVNTSNNTLTFSDDGKDNSFTLDVGWYDVLSLTSALQTAFNATLSAGSVVVSFVSLNSKFYFVFSGAVDVIIYSAANGNAMANLIGVSENLTFDTTNTYSNICQSIPRLYGLQEVFLSVDELCLHPNLIDPVGIRRNILTNIQFSGTEYLGIVSYENDGDINYIEYPTPISLSKLHFRLMDRNGVDVDLQNHNLRLVLKVYYI